MASPQTGTLGLSEFREALVKLGVAPKVAAAGPQVDKINPLS
jgi:hypothetical protein